MKIINLDQGTPEWHKFRSNHIGASDCSSIMGLNPFKSERQVWEEKVFGFQELVTNKMMKGQINEQKARDYYISTYGMIIQPYVGECETYPYISGSFDGINFTHKKLVEIKCGLSSHRLAKMGVIPIYYEAQCQHQLYLMGLLEMDYLSYISDDDAIILKVVRDEEFMERMLKKYQSFWEKVRKGEWSE